MDERDWEGLHDAAMVGADMGDGLSREVLEQVLHRLSPHILTHAAKWGFHDTEVRDRCTCLWKKKSRNMARWRSGSASLLTMYDTSDC
jgi:hypothetical protein